MERVHRQRHQVYKNNDFAIRSLNSLVREAKQHASDRVDGNDETASIHLPMHDVTERLMDSLQQMHHQLQNLMMAKMGTDARHVITAERARQASMEKARLEAKLNKKVDDDVVERVYIAKHLSEIGNEHGADELELLNEYRERYAAILGELLVAKDKLVDLEKGLKDAVPDPEFRNRISEELEELNDFDFGDRPRRTRRSSEW